MSAATLIASGAALYNRYPLLYTDTQLYLSGRNFGYRSYPYSLFLALARPTHSLWTALFLQALMIVYVLRLVMREVFGISSRIEFLLIEALLSALTSFSWCASFMVPDIFTPMLIMALFLLAFRLDRLSGFEKTSLTLIALIATSVHYSHPPIAIGLVGAAMIARMILRDRVPDAAPHPALPAAIVVAAMIVIVICNYLTMGMLSYSPAGYAFEMARLVEHGPAVAYLREQCPQRHYRVCEFLDRLPMKTDPFMWSPSSVFGKYGYVRERDEGWQIIRGTIAEHPFWVLGDAIADTINQLGDVQTGDGLRSYLGYDRLTTQIRTRFPGELQRYQNSRQSRSEFNRMRSLGGLHWGVVQLSCFYCLFLAMVFVVVRARRPLEFMIAIGVAIALNSFVLGAISEPLNRYGSRVIWLIPLIAIASWRDALGLSSEP